MSFLFSAFGWGSEESQDTAAESSNSPHHGRREEESSSSRAELAPNATPCQPNALPSLRIPNHPETPLTPSIATSTPMSASFSPTSQNHSQPSAKLHRANSVPSHSLPHHTYSTEPTRTHAPQSSAAHYPPSGLPSTIDSTFITSPSSMPYKPALHFHLSSIFASYTNTLHGSLTIRNGAPLFADPSNPSSPSVPSVPLSSPLTLGQNLDPTASSSYYDSNRLPKEIWKVESILSQIEGYLRLHDRWICPKGEFVQESFGNGRYGIQHPAATSPSSARSPSSASNFHHAIHTRNRLVKLFHADRVHRQVSTQTVEQNASLYRKMPSASSANKDSSKVLLFQSPVCQLYGAGEVILSNETANLPFSVYIPANLPPEYLSGQLIKFRYMLRIKVVLYNSYHGRKEVELELPFKVTNPSASLSRISCRQIMSGSSFLPDDVFQWTLYKDWNSVVGGRRWKLESLDRQSSSDTNRFATQTRYTFESIRQYVKSKQEKMDFDIAFDATARNKSDTGEAKDSESVQQHVCRFTISSTAFQIGESIFGCFDFSRSTIPCHRITCKLVSEEVIHSKCLRSPDTKLDASLTQRIHAHFDQHVLNLQSYPIYFTIPAQLQAQFKTDVIDLTWHLSFEFLLENNEKLKWKLPIEIFNLVSNSEQAVSSRNEVSKHIKL